jgi:hypothetical protein
MLTIFFPIEQSWLNDGSVGNYLLYHLRYRYILQTITNIQDEATAADDKTGLEQGKTVEPTAEPAVQEPAIQEPAVQEPAGDREEGPAAGASSSPPVPHPPSDEVTASERADQDSASQPPHQEQTSALGTFFILPSSFCNCPTPRYFVREQL